MVPVNNTSVKSDTMVTIPRFEPNNFIDIDSLVCCGAVYRAISSPVFADATARLLMNLRELSPESRYAPDA